MPKQKLSTRTKQIIKKAKRSLSIDQANRLDGLDILLTKDRARVRRNVLTLRLSNRLNQYWKSRTTLEIPDTIRSSTSVHLVPITGLRKEHWADLAATLDGHQLPTPSHQEVSKAILRFLVGEMHEEFLSTGHQLIWTNLQSSFSKLLNPKDIYSTILSMYQSIFQSLEKDILAVIEDSPDVAQFKINEIQVELEKSGSRYGKDAIFEASHSYDEVIIRVAIRNEILNWIANIYKLIDVNLKPYVYKTLVLVELENEVRQSVEITATWSDTSNTSNKKLFETTDDLLIKKACKEVSALLDEFFAWLSLLPHPLKLTAYDVEMATSYYIIIEPDNDVDIVRLCWRGDDNPDSIKTLKKQGKKASKQDSQAISNADSKAENQLHCKDTLTIGSAHRVLSKATKGSKSIKNKGVSDDYLVELQPRRSFTQASIFALSLISAVTLGSISFKTPQWSADASSTIEVAGFLLLFPGAALTIITLTQSSLADFLNRGLRLLLSFSSLCQMASGLVMVMIFRGQDTPVARTVLDTASIVSMTVAGISLGSILLPRYADHEARIRTRWMAFTQKREKKGPSYRRRLQKELALFYTLLLTIPLDWWYRALRDNTPHRLASMKSFSNFWHNAWKRSFLVVRL